LSREEDVLRNTAAKVNRVDNLSESDVRFSYTIRSRRYAIAGAGDYFAGISGSLRRNGSSFPGACMLLDETAVRTVMAYFK